MSEVPEARPSRASAYAVLIGVRLREAAQYRAAAWAGVFTQVMFGFIILMTLEAFSTTRPERAPMTREQLVAYVWLGQAFLALLPWTVDRDVVHMVRTGTIAYELLRPLDLYAFWFCRTLGWRVAATTLRAIPLLLLVGVLFRLIGLDAYALPPPPSWSSAAAFLLSFAVAVPLGIVLTLLVQITILWSLRIDGITRLAPALVLVCGGMTIPLPMLPPSAAAVLYFLPFRGVVDAPYRAYSGSLPPREALLAALVSAGWVLLLVLGGRVLMRRGLRNAVVHGG
jgi:viologen exporter family transport system permease protein